MPVAHCPIPGCEYVTEDVEVAIVAALITAHSMVHAPGPSAKIERVKRPTIALAGTSEDWAYFLSRWTDYVAATKLEGRTKVVQLLECCDEPLRKDLTRTNGNTLTELTADQVLTAIKALAVREENTMVARVNLHNMKQDRDETVRSFGARIRGQAGVCKFYVKCANCASDVNYTDAILRDVLTKGLADPDIQLDLLGDSNQEMNLEDVFKFVEAKEAGKRSASKLLDSNAVAAASSSYRKLKHVNQPTPKDKTETCTYCGTRGHGKSSTSSVRRNECPAYGHICDLCNRNHHIESVCRSKDKPKLNRNINTFSKNSAVFDALCTVNDTFVNAFDDSCTLSESGVERALRINHHVYDKLSETWVKKRSASQAFVNVVATVSHDDYSALGFDLKNKCFISATIPAMADTGCQSCLTGLKVLNKLGLRESDLIPVTMNMHTATNVGIKIIGATILRLRATNDTGIPIETRQMTYVCDTTDRLFLSREACSALGIIPDAFPAVGAYAVNAVTVNPHPSPLATHPCDCPKRQMPPPPPTRMPFPGTSENLQRLKTFLLDHYSAITFNTCEHQPLPLMDTPPMKLMVDDTAEPIAHHTPIPVPIHWREGRFRPRCPFRRHRASPNR
ncbi:uncharacterized protein LOC128205598 [Mya arenaria]|uniref:uncharacterized protein LOC128205598 n=1 Tax=Mya arenaria TaxID=6604 RepID=UPI0022E0AE9E|nr:uncharacterized protein LOC128205598 [Mya arenaria]